MLLFKLLVRCIFLFLSIIIFTPAFHLYMPVNVVYMLLLIAVLIIQLKIADFSLNKAVFYFSCIFCFLVVLIANYNGSYFFSRYIYIPLILISVFLFTRNKDDVMWFIDKVTAFFLIGLVFSIVSFILVYNGLEPTLRFYNPDGREIALYFATLSNTFISGLIRPSFIYDEPGTFSFFICVLAILRNLTNRDARLTWLLMSMGLITLSLAHVIIFVVYILSSVRFKYSIATIICVSLLVSFLKEESLFEPFFWRFQIDETGQLKGNSRAGIFDNVNRFIDAEIFLLGDHYCLSSKANVNLCDSRGDMSSSIFTPMYSGGIMMLLFQLYVNFTFILLAFRRPSFLMISGLMMILLLSQRPFYDGFGYLQFILLVLFVSFRISMYRNEIKQINGASCRLKHQGFESVLQEPEINHKHSHV